MSRIFILEEFNRRMLTPELSSEELDLLYRDAWDLYSVYFSPHSPDNIGFDPNLVVQMRKGNFISIRFKLI
jgi:hypothetical protein